MTTDLILIVDDHAATRQLLHGLLSSAGYDVRTAASAEEALELLPSLHPRLILIDIQLTGMDGLELTRRLKRDSATRGILVVAMTAFDKETAERRAAEAGCDAFIAKPFPNRALVSLVAAQLEREPSADV